MAAKKSKSASKAKTVSKVSAREKKPDPVEVARAAYQLKHKDTPPIVHRNTSAISVMQDPPAPLPLRLELDGEPDPVVNGSHPWLHDLEREEILRKTASMVQINPALVRLHALLADAHVRLAESATTDEVGAAQEETEESQSEVRRLEEQLANSEKETEKYAADLTRYRQEVADLSKELDETESSRESVAALTAKHQRRVEELGVGHARLTKERDAALAEVKDVRDAADERITRLEAEADSMKEVEPLATAFALLVAVDMDSEKLSEEDAETVRAALAVLGIGEIGGSADDNGI